MAEGHDGAHPNYWAIWAYLLVLTVIEVLVARLPWNKQLLIVLLLGMAIWKALLVALYFMHLRWEGMRVRIFAIAPLPLTIIVIIAVLTEYVW